MNGVSDNIIINTILDNAEKYVQLISTLPVKNKYIFNVFPPTVLDENFNLSLKGYGIVDRLLDIKDVKKFNRQLTIFNFNNLLHKYCLTYNVHFCNSYNYLIDKNNNLDKIFRLRHNKLNIHFNNEYVLMIIINTCLAFLFNFSKNKKNLKNKEIFMYNESVKKIKKTSNDYMSNKALKYHINQQKFNTKEIHNYIKNKK